MEQIGSNVRTGQPIGVVVGAITNAAGAAR